MVMGKLTFDGRVGNIRRQCQTQEMRGAAMDVIGRGARNHRQTSSSLGHNRSNGHQ